MSEPVPAVEDAIRALAHPGRRAMLRLVWEEERAASDLAEAAGLSRSAASQHLKLLREAGLVHARVDATRRLYRADLDRVAEVAGLLDDFWATPLERFKALAEQRRRSAKTAPGTDTHADADADSDTDSDTDAGGPARARDGS